MKGCDGTEQRRLTVKGKENESKTAGRRRFLRPLVIYCQKINHIQSRDDVIPSSCIKTEKKKAMGLAIRDLSKSKRP
jgi:hypothetical protein